MTLNDAVQNGFLSLSEDDATEILDGLFDIEDPQERFDQGMLLLKTVIEESKIPAVVDLVAILLDASEELGSDDDLEDEEDDHQH